MIITVLYTGSASVVAGGEPTSTASPGPTTAGTEAWWNVRLPENVIPDHYDVSLRINLKELWFDGDVSILVHVTQSTDIILVHVNLMNISEVSVQEKDGGELERPIQMSKTS